MFFNSEELYGYVLCGDAHHGANFVVTHTLEPQHDDGPVDIGQPADALVELAGLLRVGILVLEQVDVHRQGHFLCFALLLSFLHQTGVQGHAVPYDVYDYMVKWIAFQERYNEVLPTIPVYSNIYYDFYTNRLQNYNIVGHVTWTQAILEAYFR